jgi:hypothetical protein
MGAIIEDESRELEEIRGLSEAARNHIGHHLRNSLQAILLYARLGDMEGIKNGVDHMVNDLKRMGC